MKIPKEMMPGLLEALRTAAEANCFYGVDYASGKDKTSYAYQAQTQGTWVKDDPNTIDITDSCHVHSDKEHYGPSPIKELLPIQVAYNKGGNKK